jgi:hypothetical protein
VTQIHPEHSPDSSVHGNAAPVAKVDHHEHGSKALGLIALIASCLALGAISMYIIVS